MQIVENYDTDGREREKENSLELCAAVAAAAYLEIVPEFVAM